MGKYKRPAKRRAERARANVSRAVNHPEQQQAKVGAITYTGTVEGEEFTYTTSKGDTRHARKFTLV